MLDKIIRKCGKGGGCNNYATHVVIYVDARTFKDINHKPKPYCKYHAVYLQAEVKKRYGLTSRIITMDEWNHKLERYKNHGGEVKIAKV